MDLNNKLENLGRKIIESIKISSGDEAAEEIGKGLTIASLYGAYSILEKQEMFKDEYSKDIEKEREELMAYIISLEN